MLNIMNQPIINLLTRQNISLFKRCIGTLKVGTKLPDTVLMEDNPGNKVKITDLFKNKKGILLGVPGAFTPTCSNTHLPGFIKNYEKVKAKGYEVIACVTVNDPFVSGAWGKSAQASNKVRILADPSAEFTKAIHMDKDIPPLGGIRSKRYTILIENNTVTKIFEEPDGTGATCSLADNVLKEI